MNAQEVFTICDEAAFVSRRQPVNADDFDLKRKLAECARVFRLAAEDPLVLYGEYDLEGAIETVFSLSSCEMSSIMHHDTLHGFFVLKAMANHLYSPAAPGLT